MPEGTETATATTSDGTAKATGSTATAGTQTGTEGRTFTQADIDAAIKDRLDRQKREFDRKREEDERKAEEARQAEQGEFKKLAESRAAELEALKPVAERVKTLEARLNAVTDARIERLPEAMRKYVPEAAKASAEDRLAKVEELEEMIATVPTAAAPPGNGPGPKPRGGPDPARVEQGARDVVAGSRVYTRM